MNSSGSVTHLIQKVEEMKDDDAVRAIWELYFPRLVALARAKMGRAGRRVKNEEDVALSVLDTFCRGLEGGRFPNLQGRDNLWKLLVVITVRRAQRVARDEHRQKRCPTQKGVHVLSPADMPTGEDAQALLERLASREPDPAFEAMMAEEYDRLMDRLDDDTSRLIALGKMAGNTNADIGLELGCVERTVERKWKKICKRLENA